KLNDGLGRTPNDGQFAGEELAHKPGMIAERWQQLDRFAVGLYSLLVLACPHQSIAEKRVRIAIVRVDLDRLAAQDDYFFIAMLLVKAKGEVVERRIAGGVSGESAAALGCGLRPTAGPGQSPHEIGTGRTAGGRQLDRTAVFSQGLIGSEVFDKGQAKVLV